MGIYLNGREHSKLYVVGEEFTTGYVAGDEFHEVSSSESASFTIAALQINAAAVGRFENIQEEFTLGGVTWYVSSCFTHNNGLQMRFRQKLENGNLIVNNSRALAFIAADYTIDSGIAGQATFKSSQMENVPTSGAGAQYRAFPGRYTAGQNFTITIST